MTEVQEQQATADMVAEGSPAIPAGETQASEAPSIPTAADQPPQPKVQIIVGSTVHYRLSEHDAKVINNRRGANTHEPGWPKGAVAHIGNYASAGDVLPLLVTKVWNEYGTINGQVFTDGNDSLWVTSVTPRPSPDVAGCHWDWPSV